MKNLILFSFFNIFIFVNSGALKLHFNNQKQPAGFFEKTNRRIFVATLNRPEKLRSASIQTDHFFDKSFENAQMQAENFRSKLLNLVAKNNELESGSLQLTQAKTMLERKIEYLETLLGKFEQDFSEIESGQRILRNENRVTQENLLELKSQLDEGSTAYEALKQEMIDSRKTASSSELELQTQVEGLNTQLERLKERNKRLLKRNIQNAESFRQHSLIPKDLVGIFYNSLDRSVFSQNLQISATQISAYFQSLVKNIFDKKDLNQIHDINLIKSKITALQKLARIDDLNLDNYVDGLVAKLSEFIAHLKGLCDLVDTEIKYNQNNSSFDFKIKPNVENDQNNLKFVCFYYKDILEYYLDIILNFYSTLSEKYKFSLDYKQVESFLEELKALEKMDENFQQNFQGILTNNLSKLNIFLESISDICTEKNQLFLQNYQLRLMLTIMTVLYSPFGSLIKSYEKIIKVFNDSWEFILIEPDFQLVQAPNISQDQIISDYFELES